MAEGHLAKTICCPRLLSPSVDSALLVLAGAVGALDRYIIIFSKNINDFKMKGVLCTLPWITIHRFPQVLEEPGSLGHEY